MMCGSSGGCGVVLSGCKPATALLHILFGVSGLPALQPGVSQAPQVQDCSVYVYVVCVVCA